MPYHIKITEGSTVKYFTGGGTAPAGIVTENSYDVDFSTDYSKRLQFSTDPSLSIDAGGNPVLLEIYSGVGATCILE